MIKIKNAIRKNKKISLRQIISLFLLSLFIVQTLVFIAFYKGLGVYSSLKQFDRDMLIDVLQTQALHLREQFTSSWSSQRLLAQTVAKSDEIYKEHLASKKELKINRDLASSIINMCESLGASGAFVILDAEVEKSAAISPKEAFFVYDENEALHSTNYSDIFVSVGNIDFVRDMNLATTSEWQPHLIIKDNKTLREYEKIKKATKQNPRLKDSQLGYWTTDLKISKGRAPKSIFYIQPLISSNDNTFYGVVGVVINANKLNDVMRQKLANHSENISIVIAQEDVENSTDLKFRCFFDSGIYRDVLENDAFIKLSIDRQAKKNNLYQVDYRDYIGGVYPVVLNGNRRRFSASFVPLDINSKNLCNVNMRWHLLSIIENSTLYRRSTTINHIIHMAFFSSTIILFVGFIIASHSTSKGVMIIIKRIKALSSDIKIYNSDRSNIKEINDIMHSIEYKNREIATAASRMESIIAISKVPLGIIEIDSIHKKVRFMGKAKSILDLEKTFLNYDTIAQTDFQIAFRAFMNNAIIAEKVYQEDGKKTYLIKKNDNENFVSIKSIKCLDKFFLIISDDTVRIKEIKRLEYQRDRDDLTGLLGRQAFIEKTNRVVFDNIAHGVMIVFDLDNLKYINDRFGHDIGDYYIIETADHIASLPLPNLIVSRFSGDEFYAFSYGFESRNHLENTIKKIGQEFAQTEIGLLDKTVTKIRATCGITWYPDDSTNINTLIQYADFAMRQAKAIEKGSTGIFDISSYQKEYILYEGVEELNRIIENGCVKFAYQPIVEVKTHSIYSYEALMRPISDIIKNISDLIKLAIAHSKLPQIEHLTWMGVLNTAHHLMISSANHKLFLNSIPNTFLSKKAIEEIEAKYDHILPHIVVEIIESERINMTSMREKQAFCKKWGATIALDDFGAGHNSELVLLDISPCYIKIDKAIIIGVNHDENRQKIVENIVAYAKSRGQKTIAEGIENKKDLAKVIQLGVDYLQGYYLAKPNFEIIDIPEKIKLEIKNLYREQNPNLK